MGMTNTRPAVEPNGLYNMSEAGRALGVCRSSIRNYEAQGFLTFKVRRCGGGKVTTGTQIIRCWEQRH